MGIYSVVGNKTFFGEELRVKGEVDVKKLYKSLIPWFSENGYNFSEKGITSSDKPEGQEQVLEWEAYKKIDDYFKLHIDVDIRTWRWLNKRAEIYVRFKGYVETDYKRKFKGKLGDVLRKVYEDLIIKDKISKTRGKVKDETDELIAEAKKVLSLINK